MDFFPNLIYICCYTYFISLDRLIVCLYMWVCVCIRLHILEVYVLNISTLCKTCCGNILIPRSDTHCFRENNNNDLIAVNKIPRLIWNPMFFVILTTPYNTSFSLFLMKNIFIYLIHFYDCKDFEILTELCASELSMLFEIDLLEF